MSIATESIYIMLISVPVAESIFLLLRIYSSFFCVIEKMKMHYYCLISFYYLIYRHMSVVHRGQSEP